MVRPNKGGGVAGVGQKAPFGQRSGHERLAQHEEVGRLGAAVQETQGVDQLFLKPIVIYTVVLHYPQWSASLDPIVTFLFLYTHSFIL